MPNPSDVIQDIDAATGDLLWEYQWPLPDDACERILPGVCTTNRNLAIYDDLIIDTSVDEFVFALDARTGELVWETEVLDYRTHPANQSTGPIIANGKVISGRSCMPAAGPDACVITAHDARTGADRRRRPVHDRLRAGDHRDPAGSVRAARVLTGGAVKHQCMPINRSTAADKAPTAADRANTWYARVSTAARITPATDSATPTVHREIRSASRARVSARSAAPSARETAASIIRRSPFPSRAGRRRRSGRYAAERRQRGEPQPCTRFALNGRSRPQLP